MAEATLDEFALTEPLDEIELAKYKRMAVDAQTGHFPTHIYGDRDHIEVLAKALERCVETLESDNAVEVVDNAKGRIEDLESHVDFLERNLRAINITVSAGIDRIKARS